MNAVKTLLLIRTRVWFVAALMIPEQIYSSFAGQDEFGRTHGAAIHALFVVAYTIVLLVLFTCWFEFFRHLLRQCKVGRSQWPTCWAIVILLAPYGLLAYYYNVYRVYPPPTRVPTS